MRLVLCAFFAILAPLLALVFFKTNLFFKSIGALHCAGLDTTLPLRLPIVHLNFLTTLLPLLAKTNFDSLTTVLYDSIKNI
jgi:hypothetical protein